MVQMWCKLSDLSMTCAILLAFLAAARTGLDALPAAAVDTAALDNGLLLCDVPDSTFKPVSRPAGTCMCAFYAKLHTGSLYDLQTRTTGRRC